jgi:sugar phosphate isomerase/epimerase
LTDFSIEEAALILAEMGYQAIELNMETAPHFRPHVWPHLPSERRREIRHLLGDAGLALSSLSAHVSLIEVEAKTRQENVDFVKGAIDLAVDLGTDVVHVFSGIVPAGASEGRCWQWLADGLCECLDFASERSVMIAVEAAAFPGFLVWNLSSICRLIDLVGRQDLYVNFDPSHYLVAGDDVVEAFRRLRPRIVHMHAKDARGSREKFEFPPLGKGEVDWAELADAMLESNYDGYISVEYEAHVFGSGYESDPVVAARQSKAFLDGLLSRWLEAG